MIIALRLNDTILEARIVSEKNLELNGYLDGLKEDMLEHNADILDLSDEKPVFKLTPFPYKKTDSN